MSPGKAFGKHRAGEKIDGAFQVEKLGSVPREVVEAAVFLDGLFAAYPLQLNPEQLRGCFQETVDNLVGLVGKFPGDSRVFLVQGIFLSRDPLVEGSDDSLVQGFFKLLDVFLDVQSLFLLGGLFQLFQKGGELALLELPDLVVDPVDETFCLRLKVISVVPFFRLNGLQLLPEKGDFLLQVFQRSGDGLQFDFQRDLLVSEEFLSPFQDRGQKNLALFLREEVVEGLFKLGEKALREQGFISLGLPQQGPFGGEGMNNHGILSYCLFDDLFREGHRLFPLRFIQVIHLVLDEEDLVHEFADIFQKGQFRLADGGVSRQQKEGGIHVGEEIVGHLRVVGENGAYAGGIDDMDTLLQVFGGIGNLHVIHTFDVFRVSLFRDVIR